MVERSLIPLKTEAEVELCARAGALVAAAFERVGPLIRPGVATVDIDECIHEFVVARGGELLFLGYEGFPRSTCISVNEELVHGIPGPRQLENGDVVSIDVGVKLAGFCADSARTFCAGTPSPEARSLVECCRGALHAGIAAARPGQRISAISRAIESFTLAAGHAVVSTYVGHGIGRELHEEPQVPNAVVPGSSQPDPVLEPGLVIAIEPTIVAGSPRVKTLEDGWTVVTRDGSLACHCEHTVAVTSRGPRILTLAPGEPLDDC